MQDSPSAAELLDAVAAYLFSELRPVAPREQRFRVLIAANICATLSRELRAGPEPSLRDLTGFRKLLGEAPAAEPVVPGLDPEVLAREAARELADRIRAGGFDDRLGETVAVLSEHVRRKLEITRPDYPVVRI